MILTKKQREDFEKAARPLMEYLGTNHHPHVFTVIVDYGRAEILESSASIVTDDYVPD
tara:strand:+ start:273 stop:446 length:174 start_codon:yes stop_codon:yes gene_type:complete